MNTQSRSGEQLVTNAKSYLIGQTSIDFEKPKRVWPFVGLCVALLLSSSAPAMSNGSTQKSIDEYVYRFIQTNYDDYAIDTVAKPPTLTGFLTVRDGDYSELDSLGVTYRPVTADRVTAVVPIHLIPVVNSLQSVVSFAPSMRTKALAESAERWGRGPFGSIAISLKSDSAANCLATLNKSDRWLEISILEHGNYQQTGQFTTSLSHGEESELLVLDLLVGTYAITILRSGIAQCGGGSFDQIAGMPECDFIRILEIPVVAGATTPVRVFDYSHEDSASDISNSDSHCCAWKYRNYREE